MGQGTDGMDPGDDGANEDMRYLEIDRARKERLRRSNTKALVKAEVDRQLKRHGIEPKPYKPRGKMETYKCKSCGCDFQAREADRKRGWARFCDKQCAADHKHKVTGGRNRDYYGS